VAHRLGLGLGLGLVGGGRGQRQPWLGGRVIQTPICMGNQVLVKCAKRRLTDATARGQATSR
jgi:hypothetical protein